MAKTYRNTKLQEVMIRGYKSIAYDLNNPKEIRN